jgi:hypothetical protein
MRTVHHMYRIALSYTPLILVQSSNYAAYRYEVLYQLQLPFCGPGSSLSIATGYRLDGPGIIPVGAGFFAHVHTGTGAHPASCTMGTGSFPGVKRSGRGADHPPPSSAEVKRE